MNISKIEDNVQEVLSNFSRDTFIYDFLNAYGISNTSIARLQKGDRNLSKEAGAVLWKKQLFFKEVEKEALHITLDEFFQNKQISKNSPRFIIVSDYQTILAVDTKTTDKLDIPINDLSENFDFFLPLAGFEKTSYCKENAADRKAAERMAKIYEEICKANPSMMPKQKDSSALNVFLSRLLFCFFAESTGIFKQHLFTETVNRCTRDDGSDLHEHFADLFELLNTQEKRSKSKYLEAFPYVNGGLFKNRYKIPNFSQRLRKLIIECGKMDWSAINPDIFGSMIQAVVDPELRSCLGMHYTSVPNIMKVMKPLFLDDLYHEFDKSMKDKKKLHRLHKRLGEIRLFDPACGSGNFLIVAYKELRKLEMHLIKRLVEMGNYQATFLTEIQISHFYGIEIDEFACEIARLSLWLAEHQMNIEFKNIFGKTGPSLPLKEGGRIRCDNATRLDWEEFCPKGKKTEIFLLGNPPYLGTRNQMANHKEDMACVFRDIKNYKNLDYISCWFYKGVNYIRKSNSRLGFVSTSSITQGDQVSLLWSHILSKNIEIGFCYQPFKWTNSAKKNAGVSCVIIGLRNFSNGQKFIFNEDHVNLVDTINPYLTSGKRQSIARRSEPISELPVMLYGSEPRENGHLLLEEAEKRILLSEYPSAKKYLRKVTGSNEFINGIDRWCLWITDSNLKDAKMIPPIKRRFQKVSEYRKANSRKDTVKFADKPHRFTSITHRNSQSILVPIVSSDRREYIPCEFLDGSYVILNSAQAIYDAEPYIFGIISSKIHLAWVKATSGKLKNDYRYSSALSYNTFPFPDITKNQKEVINFHVFNILNERVKYPEKTIAELYDPQKMPQGLREAHRNLDVAIERCYRSKPFGSDQERLEHLFKCYEEMVQGEKKRKMDA